MAVLEECGSIHFTNDRQHSSDNKTIGVTHFARHKDN
jgi:hypothetical protein